MASPFLKVSMPYRSFPSFPSFPSLPFLSFPFPSFPNNIHKITHSPSICPFSIAQSTAVCYANLTKSIMDMFVIRSTANS